MVSLEVVSTGFFGSRCLLRMAGLENLWSRFSLDDEEEHGAKVPKLVEEVVHRLAGRFFTKRTLNVESVARTFKPLWKPTGELKL